MRRSVYLTVAVEEFFQTPHARKVYRHVNYWLLCDLRHTYKTGWQPAVYRNDACA